MAFPDTPLGVRVDMQAGGVWTDITADALTRDPITITRGQQDGASVADPSRCTVTLNNKDGRYSPRNPMSPYYGKIGRNTPIRVGVRTGPSYLLVTGAGGASTPDAAAIDITGDIDVRFDATLDNWVVNGSTDLAGKFSTAGNQRSWMLQSRDGRVHFEWSPDGATTIQADSTELAPLYQTRRAAWRVTLDVNNGSGGWTCEFFTARTMAGPWVKLGNSVTGAGVTSIFNSTNSLAVGDATNLAYTKPRGMVHAFELRNGINGTLVAGPNFAGATPGASSFTDSVGRVWNRSVTASYSNFHARHVGDVSSWPPRWAPSGQDVWTSLDASGILRRLGQGRKALDSTLRRRLPSQAGLLAYWPCEEEAGATRAYSPLPGGQPLTVSRWDFGQDDSLGGSSPLPVIAPGGTMRGAVPPPSAPSTTWALCLPYRVDGTPPVADQEMLSWTTTGTVRRWRLVMSATNTSLYGYDSAGALVLDSGSIIGGPEVYDGWWRLELVASQSGGTVNWLIRWTKVNGGSTSVGSSFSGTVGAVTGLDTTFGPGLPDIRVGHVSVWSADVIGPAYAYADHGFNEESAASRLQRLATEEARTVQIRVPTDVPLSDSTLMGPQRPDTLTALLQQCADSDLGTLLEDPQSSGLIYKRRQARYNQVPTLVLDYSAGEAAPPLEPVDDDQATRNDITVTRIGGSSARAVLETGPMSVQAPPLGVGLYDTSTTLSLATDDQPQQHAQWLLHLGTWDESRVPTVQIALHKHPHLIEPFLSLELGDRIQITNTPTWLPPGPIDLIVQGITETLGIRTWTATFTCVPAGPWTVGVTNTAASRTDTTTTTLGTAVGQADTALVLNTTQGPPWLRSSSHPTEFPLDLQVGGEQVRATAIYDVIQDAFARTASSGWGTADSGQAWTILQGTAADFSVSGGAGLQTHPTANTLHAITAPVLSSDVNLVTTYSVNVLPVGDFAYLFAMARVASTQSFYMARIRITAGTGAMQLTLRKRVGGTETELTSLTLTSTYTAGAAYRLRLAVQGTNLMARSWLATAEEPTTWQVTATDGDLTTPDVVGLRSLLGSGVTNLPIVFAFDNIGSSPQQATVTRAVNGISKSHAAGAAVRLHSPTIVAL
ncbi:hypothetical protein [Streptomyces hydrogenans]|uniref:hypothetical protein n=1 Tax=Streptomyces hydrogenans TaxID=1873719 RepID=UPI00382FD074